MTWNAETADVLYQCADCGLCRTHCITDRPLPEAIALARAEVRRGRPRAARRVRAGATPPTRVRDTPQRPPVGWRRLRRWTAATETGVALFVGEAMAQSRRLGRRRADTARRARGCAPTPIGDGLLQRRGRERARLPRYGAGAGAGRGVRRDERRRHARCSVLGSSDRFAFARLYARAARCGLARAGDGDRGDDGPGRGGGRRAGCDSRPAVTDPPTRITIPVTSPAHPTRSRAAACAPRRRPRRGSAGCSGARSGLIPAARSARSP